MTYHRGQNCYKNMFKKNCFGTIQFVVKITKQSLYKANFFACSLANRDKPVAATLERTCSGVIIFVVITKILVNLFLMKLVRVSGFSSLFSAITVFLALSGKCTESIAIARKREENPETLTNLIRQRSTRIITKIIVPRNYFVIISARTVSSNSHACSMWETCFAWLEAEASHQPRIFTRPLSSCPFVPR